MKTDNLLLALNARSTFWVRFVTESEYHNFIKVVEPYLYKVNPDPKQGLLSFDNCFTHHKAPTPFVPFEILMKYREDRNGYLMLQIGIGLYMRYDISADTFSNNGNPCDSFGKLLSSNVEDVLKLTADLWNAYTRLPAFHDSELQEVSSAIHKIQGWLAIRMHAAQVTGSPFATGDRNKYGE